MRWLLIIFIAYAWSHYSAVSYLKPSLSPSLEAIDLKLSGKVLELKISSENYLKFILQVNGSVIKKHNNNLPNRILLGWYQADNKIYPNQFCNLTVRLKRFWRLANPGSLDWEKTIFLQGIGARGYVRDGSCISLVDVSSVKNDIRETLLLNFREQSNKYINAGLMEALTFGARDDMTKDQWEILRKTGTAHLLAISGLHISSISFIAYLLSNFLFKRNAWICNRIAAQRLAAIIALVCAMFYAYLAGFSLPTQRALIMVGVGLLAIVFYKPIIHHSIFATALLLVLIMNPMSVLYPGFWMSFSAVGFIFIAINLTRHLNKFSRIIAVQLYLGAALLPISVLFFMQGSLIAPMANIVAVPWISFLVLPLLLLAEFIFALGFEASHLLFFLVDYLLDILWWFLNTIAKFEFSSIELHSTILSVLIYQIGLLLLISPSRISTKAISLVFILAMFLVKQPKLRHDEMRVTVLDVGQGLSILVETKNHSLLYDAGYESDMGFSMGEAVVEPYLKYRGIDQVDIAVISHNDNDHAGGMYHLLEQNKIKKTLVSNRSDLYPAKEIDYCRAGRYWVWDNVLFKVLHPEESWESNDNNRSCVLQIVHSQGKLLLTGDIEALTEKSLISRYGDNLSSDILIVPHHGSKSSSSVAFLTRVRPQIAVFSSAYRNRYGFPHADIIQRFSNMNILTVNTKNQGAVKIDFFQGIHITPGYRSKSQRYWHSSANTSN